MGSSAVCRPLAVARLRAVSVPRGVVYCLIAGLMAWAGSAAAEDAPAPPTGADALLEAPGIVGDPILIAQDGGTTGRELEPEYPAPPPGKPGPYNEEEGPGYNSDYIFGMTRGLAGSTMVPALKVPLFLFTVPLDIVFLPFAAVGGFFG